MLRLTLIRHAKSSWDDARLSDFERPLNARGRRDAPVMAQRLAELGLDRPHLVSSPALRAITTARTFCEVLGFDAGDIEIRPRIYDASLATLGSLVRTFDQQARHVAMFGHNPGFSELARHFAPCPFEDVPTCAIASLELDVVRWADAGPGCGRLAHYLYPKDGSG